jgi:uncharacterized membrane protein YozB (DUF420 family)
MNVLTITAVVSKYVLILLGHIPVDVKMDFHSTLPIIPLAKKQMNVLSIMATVVRLALITLGQLYVHVTLVMYSKQMLQHA